MKEDHLMSCRGITTLFFAIWLAATSLATQPVCAAVPEQSDWTVFEADCDWTLKKYERLHPAQAEGMHEYFHLRAGAGTYVYMLHQLTPSRIIDDLSVRVAVRSNRGGLQIYGRVVFPSTLDPETGKPLYALVPGQQYERVGQTERLLLENIPLMTQRQLRVLRARLRQPIDARNAYLDAVVLNAFGGPGRTELWLGEVNHDGCVEPPANVQALVQQTTFATESTPETPRPYRRTSRMIVDGRPFFPRVIEHQGEPIELLGKLGFNTIYLDHFPSVAEENAAEQAELWIVCPPPPEADWQRNARRILGWYCGENFSDRQHAPGYLDAIRRNDTQARPVIAHVEEDQWRQSRQLDVILRLREPLGTSFELSHFGRWLRESTYLVRPDTPFWAGIQTELSPELIEQVRGVSGNITNVPKNVQVEQVRQLALAAVSAGTRGLWFRSRSPLDTQDEATSLRRLMLELINQELTLIEPWCMGGQTLGIVQGQNAELQVVSLATERSRLLIPTYVQPSAQFVCRPVVGDNRLIIAGVPDSTDAFMLNHLGLSPVSRQRISGGLQLELKAASVGRI